MGKVYINKCFPVKPGNGVNRMYEEEYDEMDVESLALFSFDEDEEDFDEAKEFLRGYLGRGEA